MSIVSPPDAQSLRLRVCSMRPRLPWLRGLAKRPYEFAKRRMIEGRFPYHLRGGAWREKNSKFRDLARYRRNEI
jgi:hypothetical protein